MIFSNHKSFLISTIVNPFVNNSRQTAVSCIFKTFFVCRLCDKKISKSNYIRFHFFMRGRNINNKINEFHDESCKLQKPTKPSFIQNLPIRRKWLQNQGPDSRIHNEELHSSSIKAYVYSRSIKILISIDFADNLLLHLCKQILR